ncbi:MAG TPA: hypothetical protein VL240_10840, partial [Candidatus Binatia bacterium]|nr:hypothetical protein [Candidatus Binatia bacterium]
MAVANHRDVLLEMADRAGPKPAQASQSDDALAQRARQRAHALVWLPSTRESDHVSRRLSVLSHSLESLLSAVDFPVDADEQLPEDLQWMHDNVRLARATQSEVQQFAGSLRRVPHVRTAQKVVMPRVLAIADDFLRGVQYRYSDHAFCTYVEAFQAVTGLNMRELSLLVAALKLVVLEEFATRGREALKRPPQTQNIGDLMGSMRELSEAPWKELLEPLIVFERTLAADPAKAYARMDFQTRELYRHTVEHYAEHSDCSELEIAELSLALAQEVSRHPGGDSRLAWRKSHVGYYLIGEGAKQLRARAGVRLPFGERVQEFLRRHPDEFYLGGIELLTLLIVIAIMTPVFNAFNTLPGRIAAILLLLLPASQSAVE